METKWALQGTPDCAIISSKLYTVWAIVQFSVQYQWYLGLFLKRKKALA